MPGCVYRHSQSPRGADGSDYYELVWANPRVVLRGLDPTAAYSLRGDDGALQYRLPGALLMSAGLPIVFSRDGSSGFYELVAD
jgi:hypothetical protein